MMQEIVEGVKAGEMTAPQALAGVILLLPGLSITIGVSELAARHLSSGTARLAGAAMTLINLGVGSFLGFALVDRIGLVSSTGVIRADQAAAALAVAVIASLSRGLCANAYARLSHRPAALTSYAAACLPTPWPSRRPHPRHWRSLRPGR